MLDKHDNTRSRTRPAIRRAIRRGTRRAARRAVESLERRVLLCGLPHEYLIEAPQWSEAIEQQYASPAEGGPDAVSIVWANRGQQSDNFAAAFGASANAARAVVDAVLNDWARVITAWNRTDAQGNPDPDVTLQVNISIGRDTMGNLVPGFGGGGAPAATAPADGRPRTGSFTLGAGNLNLFPSPDDSNGWYFDANPDDHAEFNGPITSAYAGNAPGGINNDFYTVASAELLHVLGLVSDMNNNGGNWQGYRLESSGLATNTGIADTTDGGGTFWTFDGPTVDHLMTSFNGGGSWGNVVHAAGPGANIDFAGRNWRGSASTGNGRGGGGRVIPDFPMAHMLADAYGYSIVEPFAFDTFHYLLNRQTGELLIRGMTGAGNSADVITVGRSGNFISVSVDIGNDTPGTGALPGAGNLPAFTALFPSSDVNSITIAAMDGNDTINLDGMFANIPVLIDGGFGNDTINLTPAGDNLDLLSSQLTVQGSDGTSDVLVLHDTANAFPDSFTITNNSVDRDVIFPINYNGLEQIRINTGSGGTTFNVNSLFAAVDLQINAGAGADIFHVGPVGGNFDAVDGDVSLFGQGDGVSSGDTLNINDSTHAANSTYTLTSIDFQRPGAGRVNWGTVEGFFFNLGSGANTVNINSTPNASTMTVNAGGGADTINLGLSAASTLTINGGDLDDVLNVNNPGSIGLGTRFNGNAGSDTLNYNDASHSANASYTLNASFIGRDGAGGLQHGTVETIVVNAGILNDTFVAAPMPAGTTLRVNGGNGNDHLQVAFLAANLGAGAFEFNGNAGTDTAELFDDLSNATAYTVTATQVTRSGFGGFTHGTIEGLLLSASDASSTIYVNATASGAPLTVHANGGNDVVHITQASGNLQSAPAGITINGGSGSDSVRLWDNLSAQNDTTVVNASSILHPSFGGLTHSNLENVEINSSGGDSRIELNATSSLVTTTVNGNAGNDLMILGGPLLNLNTAAGPIVLNGGAGTDSAVLWDSFNQSGETYTISSTTVATPGMGGLTYGTLEGLTLNATPGVDLVTVNSAPAGLTLTLNGDDASDRFIIGAGDFDDQILGQVIVNGSSGGDLLDVNDGTDGIGADIYSIEHDGMRKLTGGDLRWSSIATVTVAGSPNADLYEILASQGGTALVVNGGNGSDQFQLGKIGVGDLEVLTGPVTINGQGGTSDTVALHDSGSSASDAYTISPTQVTHPNFAGLTYATMEGLTLHASSGDNGIAIATAASCPVTISAAGGTDVINVNETAAGAPVTIAPSPGDDTVNVNPGGAGTANAIFSATQRIGALSISAGGSAAIVSGADKVLTSTSVSIAGNGALDLGDNDMVIDYAGGSPLAAINALVTSGYNGGAWTGGGIRSSTAATAGNTGVGIAEATDLFSTFPATFSGQSIDNTAVLLKYTPYGDTNLDGQVNLSDFNRLAASFGQSSRRWAHGDTNYDGTVNLSDFNRLAANFGAAGFAATSGFDADELLEQLV